MTCLARFAQGGEQAQGLAPPAPSRETPCSAPTLWHGRAVSSFSGFTFHAPLPGAASTQDRGKPLGPRSCRSTRMPRSPSYGSSANSRAATSAQTCHPLAAKASGRARPFLAGHGPRQPRPQSMTSRNAPPRPWRRPRTRTVALLSGSTGAKIGRADRQARPHDDAPSSPHRQSSPRQAGSIASTTWSRSRSAARVRGIAAGPSPRGPCSSARSSSCPDRTARPSNARSCRCNLWCASRSSNRGRRPLLLKRPWREQPASRAPILKAAACPFINRHVGCFRRLSSLDRSTIRRTLSPPSRDAPWRPARSPNRLCVKVALDSHRAVASPVSRRSRPVGLGDLARQAAASPRPHSTRATQGQACPLQGLPETPRRHIGSAARHSFRAAPSGLTYINV